MFVDSEAFATCTSQYIRREGLIKCKRGIPERSYYTWWLEVDGESRQTREPRDPSF